MHWHFGGNFEPLMKICSLDWMECPYALAYYVWYEIVADVVDCLANETILWETSGILLICGAIIYLIYWKIRCTNVLDSNQENSKHLDLKINDLELKVNILNYKAQYGIWPQTQFTSKNIKNVQNISPPLPVVNDENLWFKYLLMGGQKKNINDKRILFNIKSHLSISDLNPANIDTKYTPSKFEDLSIQKLDSINGISSETNVDRDQNKDTLCSDLKENEEKTNKAFKNNLSENLIKNNLKPYINSSIDYHYIKNILGTQKNLQTNIDAEILQSDISFSDNILSDTQEIIDFNFGDEKIKLLHSTLDSNIIPKKFEEKYFTSTDTDTEIYTHETLDCVKNNLENIHLTLQNCCLKDYWKSVLISDRNSINVIDNPKKDDLYKIIEENNKNYNILDNNKCNYEKNVSIQSSINNNLSSTTVSTIPFNFFIGNEQMPVELDGYISNNKYSTSEDIEIKQDEQIENQYQSEQSNDCKGELNEHLATNNVNAMYSTDKNKYNKSTKCLPINSKFFTNNEIEDDLSKSSSPETSKENDSDEKSTNALIEEALKIKKELLMRIEMNQNNYNKEMETKYNDIKDWHNTEFYFQPKVLDMITEESSDSCSTNKKTNVSNILNNDKNFEEIEAYPNNRNQLSSNEIIKLINKHSTEIKIFKNNTELKEVQNNLLNKDTNKNCQLPKEKNIDELFKYNENKNLSENSNRDPLIISQNDACNEIFDISKMNKVPTNTNQESSDFNSNLNQLTDSSSDISVDKLIDRLIENERKSKTAKNISDTQSKEKFQIDSLNFINSHNFLESLQSETEECNNLTEFNSEKLTQFEEKIINDNFQIHSEKKALNNLFGIENSVDYNKKSVDITNNIKNNSTFSEVKDKKNDSYNKISDDKKFIFQDDSKKNNISSLNSRHKSQIENVDEFIFEYNSKIRSNKNVNEQDINNIESKNNNSKIDVYENKKNTDLLISKNALSRIDNPIQKDITINTEVESKESSKRDAGDFYNESYPQNCRLKEEIWNKKVPEINNEIIKNNLPCGDTNSSIIESNSIPISPKKQKNCLYHASCKVPSDNYISSVTRNSEQNFLKINKNTGLNLMQKSLKNSVDVLSNRQLKTKSNLNLTTTEKYNLLSTNRRSKSYIPCDISLNPQNNPNEKKIESLTSSSKSCAKINTAKEFFNYNKNKNLDLKNVNSYDLPKLDSNSFSHIPASKGILIDNTNLKGEIKMNTLLNCLTSSDSSSSKSFTMSTPIDFSTENQSNSLKNKNYLESQMLSSKLSPKSCITFTSNNNSQDIIKIDSDPCQIDSAKESLTTLFDGYRLDGEHKSESIEDNIKNLKEENHSVFTNQSNSLHSDNSNQNSKVFVNFLSDNGKITNKVLSSEEFLKYIKEGDLKIRNFVNHEHADLGILNHTQLMTLSKSQGTAVIPLVTNSDITLNYTCPSVLESKDSRSDLCPLKVESKETEVLVKPSCIDTSTSVSDLSKESHVSKNKTQEIDISVVKYAEELTRNVTNN